MGRLFRVLGLQHALIVFLRALAACAPSKLARRPSVIEGGKLTLEAGGLEDLPAILLLPLHIVAAYDSPALGAHRHVRFMCAAHLKTQPEVRCLAFFCTMLYFVSAPMRDGTGKLNEPSVIELQ